MKYVRALSLAPVLVLGSAAPSFADEPIAAARMERAGALEPPANHEAPRTEQRDVAAVGALVARGEGAPGAEALDAIVGNNQTAVSSQAISVPQGAGKIQGMGESFSAQLSTGIVTWSLPIALPTARGAAQPSLKLAYTSARGAGVAGVGWSLPTAFIARQTDRGVPRYRDPAPGGAWSPDQDRFVFGGGQELVPICLVQGGACSGALAGEVMPQWANGWQYFRARVEGAYLRFFWSPDHRTWRVQAKTGVSMELGAPLDAPGDTSALETAPGEPSKIYRWNIAREYDAQGPGNPAASATPHPVNVVAYRWTSVGGVAYLVDVFDTPPASAAGAASPPALESYAHHARLRYEARPDTSSSHRRGYRVANVLRLAGVDVTSKSFVGGAAAPRELVRRFALSYDATIHASLLVGVQQEGRCASPVREDSTLALPPTSCPKLPAMTLDYQHVAGTRDLAGFEAFDERLHAMATSPRESLQPSNAELMDVDADALPDVLVTGSAVSTGSHQVFLNGASGIPDAFGGAIAMGVDGALGADSRILALGNPNLATLDVDGDGLVDFFHMPTSLKQSVYSARRNGSGFLWAARAMATPTSAGRPIDFHDPRVRVADVDGDGLVDILTSTGTSYATLFSLGRHPGGDGAFGTATWTGATTASLSTTPVSFCVPFAATPVRLGDEGVRLADMNGDGLVDVVRVRFGDIKYWPGDGRGRFGLDVYDVNGRLVSCDAGTFGEGRHVAMSSAPDLPGLREAELRLDDVNGDGLDDFVRVRRDAIDVWLNVDGKAWTDRHVVRLDAPLADMTRVRLVDVNGSGTRDVVIGDAGNYRYFDLLGGQRPWVLTKLSNGLGKTTEIEFQTSTQAMLAAAAAGQPWTSTMPVVAHVVRRVTEKDAVVIAGHATPASVTEYTFRDPAYDGRQREFRGFASATVKHLGDADTPSDLTTTLLGLGACADDTSDTSGLPSPCSFAGRWRDNPREALKGLPVVEERSNESGKYLATDHTQYTLQKLYSGLDGRGVWRAFASRYDTWRYDVGSWVASSGTASIADVVGDAPRTLPLRATAATAQVARTHALDLFGEETAAVSLGCVAGCTADDAITRARVTSRIAEASGWMFRASEAWTEGGDHVKRRWTKTSYDTHGNPTSTRAVLVGTLPLQRAHETPGKAIAPPPQGASVDGEVAGSVITYDDFGNVTKRLGPVGRSSTVAFDSDYQQLPVGETTFAGAIDPVTGVGRTPLTTIAAHDRGTNVVTDVFGPNGEVTRVAYDGFARLVSLTRPDPTTGALSASPSLLVDYDLPSDPTTRPYTIVHARSADGADPGRPSYRDVWTFADGGGRDLAALEQADPSAGDGGGWVVRGVTERDAKGATKRVYQPWFWTGSPAAFPLAASPPGGTLFTRTAYDAFGRRVEAYGLDGLIASRSVHHALSVDEWDAADLDSTSPHFQSYATSSRNGHGQLVQTIDRLRVAGNMASYITYTRFLPSGEPFMITRTQSGQNAVTRWMAYDTLGRMVLNVDPSTSSGYVAPLASPLRAALPGTLKAWRYAFNDAGDIVGTSDARGCGANYAYEAAGRRVAEDYSPCRADHAPYSPPDLATGDGVEVLVRYDAIDFDASAVTAAEPGFTFDSGAYVGRIASITDRSSKLLMRHDRRGRTTGVAKRVAKPGVASASVAARFAPRWYVQTFSFDAADREIEATTGARVPELLAGGARSAVQTRYTKRGTVAGVGSSHGDLVASVKRDADGLVKEVRWGDGAATTTAYAFDARRRVTDVQTFRAKAPMWSNSTTTYSAPDAATTQLLLEDGAFTYDVANNPLEIKDQRIASEWPAGAQPVSRKMQYDGLYRLTRVDYTYASGDDAWTSPYAEESSGDPIDTRRAAPSPHVAFDKRVRFQTYAYDALGNTQSSDDDAHGFYDRSLGAITNGTLTDGPYQLRAATGAASTRDGALAAKYDEAGNLIALSVTRHGSCLPSTATCSQRFDYGWDEVGRLVRARRWDTSAPGPASGPTPTTAASAELVYAYDGGDNRVRKTALDAAGHARHTIYVFGSLELRGANWDAVAGDYERTAWTEVSYLFAHGVRLGRVHYAGDDVPRLQSGHVHVLLELADHLGSGSIVLDRESGELVERGTYTVYGAVESDYRPGRWGSFREDYRFTGKEEDIEVGLSYFGKRFYSPSMARWVSADPLAVHSPGSADLNLYAYVHARLLAATDALGLDDGVGAGSYAPPIAEVSNVPGGDAVHSAVHGTTTASAPASSPLVGPSCAIGEDASSWYVPQLAPQYATPSYTFTSKPAGALSATTHNYLGVSATWGGKDLGDDVTGPALTVTASPFGVSATGSTVSKSWTSLQSKDGSWKTTVSGPSATGWYGYNGASFAISAGSVTAAPTFTTKSGITVTPSITLNAGIGVGATEENGKVMVTFFGQSLGLDVGCNDDCRASMKVGGAVVDNAIRSVAPAPVPTYQRPEPQYGQKGWIPNEVPDMFRNQVRAQNGGY